MKHTHVQKKTRDKYTILTNPDKYKISDEHKYNLHKIWIDNQVIEVAGRLTTKPYIDVIGYKTGMPYSKIRYDLPGIPFHTHPKISEPISFSETLTPPSAEDYINIIKDKRTEYILTEHGIWMIQPIRINTFITECALSYYVLILNMQLATGGSNNSTHRDDNIFSSLVKSKQNINSYAKTYSKLISDPNGRLLNISNKKILKIFTNQVIEMISQLYSTAPSSDIEKSILIGMSQFIGDPPVKVTWHPY